MLNYLRRVWAFRNSTRRDPGPAGKIHRLAKLASLVTFTVVFTLAHGASAEPNASNGSTNGSATNNASTVIPQLPSAVASDGSTPAANNLAAPTPAVPSLPGTPTNPAANPNSPVITVATVSTPQVGTSTSSGSRPASIGIDLGDQANKPSTSVIIIVGLTLLSLAPSLLIMMTSFTRMVIVLGLTRNAIGLQSVPPNQLVVGLALFLSLFVMGPTLSKMNDVALQPMLKGQISTGEAISKGSDPLKQFMLRNTRKAELSMMISASRQKRPATPDKVSMTTLVPAFVLSELKTAFIIGFVIFIPFLVIDLVVSSVLMSLGMMMLPPAFVALPFKLLLFVMVDGWSLVAKSLVESFR